MAPSRAELDHQSDTIEAVLATHKIPSRVDSAVVSPPFIQFHLVTAPGVKVRKVTGLADAIALALRCSRVPIYRRGGRFHRAGWSRRPRISRTSPDQSDPSAVSSPAWLSKCWSRRVPRIA